MSGARYGQRSYDAFLAPMELAWFGKWRKRMLSGLSGEVLDIGSGTGINLRYYPEDVDCVTVLDPNEKNLAYLEKRAEGWGYGNGRCLRSRVGYGEDLPFGSGSFDHVVSTLILCTVEDPEKVISEGIRVLKKGGTITFMEHQLPIKGPQAFVFNKIAPVWRAPSGCNLNRNSEQIIRSFSGLKEITSFRGGPLLGYPFFIGNFKKY
ncbi:MAG: class I SAM-dependent methyltransferase [Thermoplasmatota archaeon]